MSEQQSIRPDDQRHDPALRDYLVVLAGYLGLAVITQSAFKTITVWPSAGVALAAFLVFGVRIWPSIALGTFLAVLAYFMETGQALFSLSNLVVNLATVMGNTLAAAIALRMCGRMSNQKDVLAQFDWVASKFLLAIFVFGFFSALPGVGVYWLIGQPWSSGYLEGVAGWVISDSVGALVITPLLVKMWMDGFASVYERQLKHLVLALPGLLVLVWFIFGPGQKQLSPIFQQPSMILIPLVFVAVSASQALTFLVLALTFFAVWVGTSVGYGPFVASSEAISHASMQIFIGFSATVILLLQALVQEHESLREQWAEDLRRHNLQLEKTIEQRTAELESHVNMLGQAQRIGGLGNYVLDISTGNWTSSRECDQLLGIDATYARTMEGWSALIHPSQRAMMTSYLSNEVLRLRSTFDKTFLIVRHNDGVERWIHSLGQLEFDPHGMLQTLHVTIQDVTERKQAEEALKRYKDHLEDEVQTRTADLILARDAADAANKAKSVFLNSISHELRTPLNAILGFSSLLRQDAQLRPEQRTNLDIINRSGEHLLTLINDVLEMAKIEAGRTQLNNAPFDFGAVVRDVADMMRMRAQEKGLSLLIDQPSEFPRHIRSDEARLRQVLINLVGNAIKFTRTGGVTLRFGVMPHDAKHQLLIDVEDTGIGISAEEQQHLFQPFIQMGAQPGDNKGTGLGLALTKQFVHLMGGTISVESTPGKGSLFRVKLPFSKVEASELSELDSSSRSEVGGLAPGQSGYRILIAEDQLENQLLMSQLMQRIGVEFMLAGNGEQAVHLFQSWRPHLIWMDRLMPVMDGMQATRAIRALPGGKDVKIVAVTASAFAEQRVEMLAGGMDDVVRKPYRASEIYECLGKQLGLRYVYAETPQAPGLSARPLTVQMLAGLPESLRNELKAALESLDGERIKAVIGQVESRDEDLYQRLWFLASNFDYPAILSAL